LPDNNAHAPEAFERMRIYASWPVSSGLGVGWVSAYIDARARLAQVGRI
jgi:hypothetical protein